MTDNTQELDDILSEFGWRAIRKPLGIAGLNIEQKEAKQAILAWHNKQIEEVIKKPHILPKNAQHMESLKQGINFYHRQMRKRVDKLKGVTE